MLVIRAEQMDTLAEQAHVEMLVRVSQEHLAGLFPEELAGVGLEERRARIAHAVCAAWRRLRLHELDLLRWYTEAVLLLGAGFEDDPRHSWARPLLDDPDAATLRERLQALSMRARMAARLAPARAAEGPGDSDAEGGS